MPSARHDDIYNSSRKRSRSRSPIRDSSFKRQRSRSPSQRSRHHYTHHKSIRPDIPKLLPYQRAPLSKHDLERYEALFAEYLAVQKNIEIRSLTRDEVKGRWKSFLGKWNRGELAEGWYDPAFGKRCEERYSQDEGPGEIEEDDQKEVRRVELAGRRESGHGKRDEPRHCDDVGANGEKGEQIGKEQEQDDDDDDDGYGPAPLNISQSRAKGPVIPRLQDLQERREQVDDDYAARRADLRFERKQERQIQKERLDELIPRAEAGTRERQLEKKRDVAASNRAFKDAKEAGDVEVKDGDLLGEDGAEEYKAEKKKREKVKNEREIRKEEVLRARAAEREERLTQMRGKEEKTMDMLRELAKARFG